VFLDRDGVLNEDRDDYVKSIAEMRMLPGVGEAIRQLRDAGYLCILITNQSPIGRGIFTVEHLESMHEWLRARLREEGGELDDILYCPHRPDEACACRKPQPGLLLEAIARHRVDPTSSFMVGDREGDIAAGRAAGVQTIRIVNEVTGADAARTQAEFRTADLPTAVEYILRETKPG